MPYDGTFARCISLLMLDFLPDYRQATAEMVRLAWVGGTVGAVRGISQAVFPRIECYDTAAALDPQAGS